MDQDPYKVLGLRRDASKDEIKQAFRKLAMKFHPDKHSHSAQSIRDAATLRFKQLSEAYDVLADDRKRASYNLRSHSPNTAGFGGGYGYYSGGNGRNSGNSYARDHRSRTSGSFGNRDAWAFALQLVKTRTFHLNLAFAGVLLAGAVMIEDGRERLWKMQNSGKSFEDAMESIEKAKVHNDRH